MKKCSKMNGNKFLARLGIIFTTFCVSQSLAFDLKLERGEWAARPVFIFLQDWDGLQIWGNEERVCIPLGRLEFADRYGVWIPEGQIEQPRDVRYVFQYKDWSCNTTLGQATHVEVFRSNPPNPHERIFERHDSRSPIVWVGRGIASPQDFFATVTWSDRKLRTAILRVPFVEAHIMSLEYSFRQLAKGELSKSADWNNFALRIKPDTEETDTRWIVRYHPEDDLSAEKVKQRIEAYVVREFPALQGRVEYVSSPLIAEGTWQILSPKNPQISPIAPPVQVFKPRQLDPKEISANTREKQARVDDALWTETPGWFSQGQFKLNGLEMTWLERRMAIYKFKEGEALLTLNFDDPATKLSFQQTLAVKLPRGRKLKRRIQPTTLKVGPNVWEIHRISLK